MHGCSRPLENGYCTTSIGLPQILHMLKAIGQFTKNLSKIFKNTGNRPCIMHIFVSNSSQCMESLTSYLSWTLHTYLIASSFTRKSVVARRRTYHRYDLINKLSRVSKKSCKPWRVLLWMSFVYYLKIGTIRFL